MDRLSWRVVDIKEIVLVRLDSRDRGKDRASHGIGHLEGALLYKLLTARQCIVRRASNTKGAALETIHSL